MKTLDFNDVIFELIVTPEDMQLEGNLICSGDAEFDAQIIDETLQRVNSGDVWAWCTVELRGTYRGVLTASDYLGGCSYANEQEFKQEGGYYQDMKQSVLRLLQDQIQLVNA